MIQAISRLLFSQTASESSCSSVGVLWCLGGNSEQGSPAGPCIGEADAVPKVRVGPQQPQVRDPTLCDNALPSLL
uniref:Uncharacterized protein n=1 Tax=Arundo donax TaxID=35708 RepID=A0A0A8ZP97_ARUDO